MAAALQIEVPALYPLSFVVVALYAVYLFWCGIKVVQARKKYGVKLPAAYENKDDSIFNRYQRVHQNAVEGAAIFYATLLISALKTPLLSAAAGFIYLVGRILYALGYYAASEKRARGSFFFLAQFYLIGGTLFTAGSLLMST